VNWDRNSPKRSKVKYSLLSEYVELYMSDISRVNGIRQKEELVEKYGGYIDPSDVSISYPPNYVNPIGDFLRWFMLKRRHNQAGSIMNGHIGRVIFNVCLNETKIEYLESFVYEYFAEKDKILKIIDWTGSER